MPDDQQWPAQPQLGAPWPPPQRPRRQGVIIGVIIAVTVVAVLIIAVAAIATHGTRQAAPVPTTAPSAAASVTTAPPSSVTPTRTAAQAQELTCTAVKLSIAAVGATPTLPKGWTKDTPNIEALMGATRQGMIDAKKYIVVEPGTPEDVALRVREYADAQQALIDHAYVTTPFSELMQYSTRADTASAVAQAAACGK